MLVKQPWGEEIVQKRFNTHVVINDDGVIMRTYRKMHLIDIDLSHKGGVKMHESQSYEAGQ